MNRRTPARQLRMGQLLTEKALPRRLKGMLPRASNYTSPNYEELLRELNHFGINTVGQFRALLLRNRREAIRIDRAPLDAVNTRIYRQEYGDAEFYERIRTNTWFSWEGLIRVILELEFQDEYRAFANKRDAA
jgi:hypothetical protein